MKPTGSLCSQNSSLDHTWVIWIHSTFSETASFRSLLILSSHILANRGHSPTDIMCEYRNITKKKWSLFLSKRTRMASSYRVHVCWPLTVFLVGVLDPAAKCVQVLVLGTANANACAAIGRQRAKMRIRMWHSEDRNDWFADRAIQCRDKLVRRMNRWFDYE